MVNEVDSADEIWTRYLPRLTRWAEGRRHAIPRDAVGTSDVVQHAFAHARTRSPAPDAPGTGALFTRFRAQALPRLQGSAGADGSSSLESAVAPETLARYERAFADLSKSDQAVVVLVVELGCTDQELAEILEELSADAAEQSRAQAIGHLARGMEGSRTPLSDADTAAALAILDGAGAPPGDDHSLFLDEVKAIRSVMGAFRDILDAPDPPIETLGGSWGPFTLKDELGRGSYGVVYRAFDPAVARDVALKIYAEGELPAEPRFLGRVRHPNVVTVFGAAVHEGRAGIWMELVEGRTLAARVTEDGPVTPEEAVRIGVDLCRAVAAVHEAGLVHQDIKPRNAMEERGGRIALMDLGAGRLLEDAGSNGRAGTPLFMAPEVVLGGSATVPSDVYSLGVLLYYLLTGTYPLFADDVDRLRGLHEQQLDPRTARHYADALRALRPAVSRRLARCVDKALGPKDTRYPTAAAFGAALARSERRWTPGTTRGRMAVAIALGAVLATGVGALRWSGAPPRRRAPALLKTVPLTAQAGMEMTPALSPDGRSIAYVWRKDGRSLGDIYVKTIETGAPRRLTEEPGYSHLAPTWSPDGREIAFFRAPGAERGTEMSLHVMPAAGGPARRIGPGSDWSRSVGAFRAGLSWSPDGRSLAISFAESPEATAGIFLVPLAGGPPRRLTGATEPGWRDSLPAFSPDGREVAFVRIGHVVTMADIWIVPVTGGAPRRITHDETTLLGLTWHPSSQEIVFSSWRSGVFRLWRVSARAGGRTEPEVIADVGEGATWPSVGSRLAYTMLNADLNIRSLRLDGSRRETLVVDSTREDLQPQFSPDGTRLAFGSARTGRYEIWVANADGSDPVQITSLRANAGTPQWSPDGRRLVFDARVGQNTDVYVVDAAGGSTSRITTEPAEDAMPSWSRNGRWLYFSSARSGTTELWRSSPDGSAAVRVTVNGGFAAMESPDGRYLYFSKKMRATGLWRIPISDGAPGGPVETVLPAPRLASSTGWAPTHAGVYYLGAPPGNPSARAEIRLLDPSTGESSTIHRPEREATWGLTVSPDGKTLAWGELDRMDAHIMLADDFQ